MHTAWRHPRGQAPKESVELTITRLKMYTCSVMKSHYLVSILYDLMWCNNYSDIKLTLQAGHLELLYYMYTRSQNLFFNKLMGLWACILMHPFRAFSALDPCTRVQ